MEWFRGRKPVGTVVQHRNGYVFVKTATRGWVAESRLVAEIKLVKRELVPGEKVFHRNGERDSNEPGNLVVIKFNMTKYQFLPSARIVHLPKPQITEKELAKR